MKTDYFDIKDRKTARQAGRPTLRHEDRLYRHLRQKYSQTGSKTYTLTGRQIISTLKTERQIISTLKTERQIISTLKTERQPGSQEDIHSDR